MNQSEDIKDLAAALSKAQGQLRPAVFNKQNPHFKNRYADFTSCMDACRVPLSENGLCVMQYCDTVEGKLMLVTMLAHASGQFIKSFFPLTPKDMTSQSIGSAMTYAKRYSLSSMLGIVSDDEDDDGEAAHGRNVRAISLKAEKEKAPPVVYVSGEELIELDDLFDKCSLDFRSKLLKHYDISNLNKIPLSDFDRVKTGMLNNIKTITEKTEELKTKVV